MVIYLVDSRIRIRILQIAVPNKSKSLSRGCAPSVACIALLYSASRLAYWRIILARLPEPPLLADSRVPLPSGISSQLVKGCGMSGP